MSANEIITVHFGPYANFVGAVLANHEYRETFGTTHPVSPYDSAPSGSTGAHHPHGAAAGPSGRHAVDRDVYFLPAKAINESAMVSSSRHSSYYVPRAIFCDFEGAIPARQANQIAIGNFAKAQSHQRNYQRAGYDPLTAYEDTFSSYQSMYSSVSGNTGRGGQDRSALARRGSDDPNRAGSLTHEHLYWHNILYPHLRPMVSCPERVILAASSHVLGLQADTILNAEALLTKPPSATSAKHEDTFGETLFDQFRSLVERCDRPQGVRIIADTSSIWAGVCSHFVQHLENQYPSLDVIVIGVSTALNLDRADADVGSELFASQIHTVPYSPFSPAVSSGGAPAAFSPSQAKTSALNLRECRTLNSALFAAQFSETSSRYAYVPVTIPLTPQLKSFIATKVPQLTQRYQRAATAPTPGATATATATATPSFPPETEANLAALAATAHHHHFTASILYHFLTAPQIATALFTLFEPLAFVKSSSSAATATPVSVPGGTDSTALVVTLAALVATMRPRNALPMTTLAHRHDPLLFSHPILTPSRAGAGASADTASSVSHQYSTTFVDNALFPVLDLPSVGPVPVWSNMFSGIHAHQRAFHQKQQQQQQAATAVSFDSFSTSSLHGSRSHSGSAPAPDIASLYGNESADRVDPRLERQRRTITVGGSYTIGHFDDSRLESIAMGHSGDAAGSPSSTTGSGTGDIATAATHGSAASSGAGATAASSARRVVDGVFSSSAGLQQWRFECDKRRGQLQRGLYATLAATKHAQFFFVPQTISTSFPSSSSSSVGGLGACPELILTSAALTGMENLGQVFGYSSGSAALITPGVVSPSSGTGPVPHKSPTLDYLTLSPYHHALRHSAATKHESLSTLFLSPQLAPGFRVLSGQLKFHTSSTIRTTWYRDIEQDDWVTHYNALEAMGTEYREMDVYGMDADDPFG